MKIVPMEVKLIDSMGSDLSVVNAARVSFHKESDWDETLQERIKILSEKDAKLIAYLAKHNHWSPFAHTSLQFRIKAPIFVARQLVKHQVGGVWNEVSRRYVDDEPEFWFPAVWRGKPVNAKQGSSDVVVNEYYDSDTGLTEDPSLGLRDTLYLNVLLYNDFIKAGVAPEQARMVLPQNMMSEWIWTGSLMFFARVCNLRLDAHAQMETQEVAQLINQQVPKEFEHSWRALRGT